MIDPQLQSKIALWRQKVADGTITLEEMREAIILMRQSRMSAASQPKASKAKASTKAAPRSASDLLGELGSL